MPEALDTLNIEGNPGADLSRSQLEELAKRLIDKRSELAAALDD